MAEKNLQDEWDLSIGTKRYHPEWLRDRLRWRDSEGVPTKADWKLSSTAKHISALQTLNYFHPDDEKDFTEDELKPEIQDAIAEDLELKLQNPLSEDWSCPQKSSTQKNGDCWVSKHEREKSGYEG